MKRRGVVYALVHEKLKLFHVGNSTSLGQAIQYIINNLDTKHYENMKALWNELELHILHENIEIPLIRRHLTFVEIQKKKEAGYTPILSSNNHHIPTPLKVVCEMCEMYTREDTTLLRWTVSIKNRNKRIEMLGIFHTENEAMEWMNKHYSNGELGMSIVHHESIRQQQQKKGMR